MPTTVNIIRHRSFTTGRQTDRKIDRQTNRQTGRQADRYSEIEIRKKSNKKFMTQAVSESVDFTLA